MVAGEVRFLAQFLIKKNNMNPNALTQKSKAQEKTNTGKARCGFRKTDGYIMSQEEYFAELKKNGYKIEKLKNGILISK